MISSFLHDLSELYTIFVTTILTARQLRADSEPVKSDFDRLVAQSIDIEKRDELNNNKSSSLKALKTESAESERNSERKKEAEKGSFTFINLNSAKCSVCNLSWHMKNKCWVKNSAQALKKWREENESRIDKYRQKSKNLNKLNTSERKKKKLMSDIVAKCHGARSDKPRQTIMCSARQSRAALLALRVIYY